MLADIEPVSTPVLEAAQRPAPWDPDNDGIAKPTPSTSVVDALCFVPYWVPPLN